VGKSDVNGGTGGKGGNPLLSGGGEIERRWRGRKEEWRRGKGGGEERCAVCSRNFQLF